MIPQGVQIFVALEPIKLCFSFDRLSGLAKEQVGYDPRSGALFIFFGRRRDALKILFFDGSGMCQFYKKLDKGAFRIPEAMSPHDRHIEVDAAMLETLLDGIDVEKKIRARPRPVPELH